MKMSRRGRGPTNGVVYNDLCYDSDDEKPIAKGHSSPTNVTVGTYAIGSLLRKKPPPTSAATAEAATQTASPEDAMALFPPPADVDPDDNTDDVDGAVDDSVDDVGDVDDEVDIESATGTQSNNHPRAVQTTHIVHWTLQADAELTSGITARVGKWAEDEDAKLKNSIKLHGGKDGNDWIALAALVRGRAMKQCRNRCRNHLKHSISWATDRTGKWTAAENDKLVHAVQKHCGKDWDAIAALVPGRTKIQCSGRWHYFLKKSIDQTAGNTGKWTEAEDNKLKDAAQKHGGTNWAAIAALVPGRTKIQCQGRLQNPKHSIDGANGHRGCKWTEDEDNKLKNAVQRHDGKHGKTWAAIAALVPDRTQQQCKNRWHAALDPNVDRATGYTGKWKEDEDIKLKDAVQKHAGKGWAAITALVPGRTRLQCSGRWNNSLKHSIDKVH